MRIKKTIRVDQEIEEEIKTEFNVGDVVYYKSDSYLLIFPVEGILIEEDDNKISYSLGKERIEESRLKLYK